MPAESRSLKGNVIAITGASSGIGREAARLLVEAGAKVALGARRLDRLNALVEELGSDNALAVEMDVTSPQDNNGFIAQTLGKFGPWTASSPTPAWDTMAVSLITPMQT